MHVQSRTSAGLGALFALVAACALSACDRNVSPTPSTTPGTTPGTTDPADQRRNDNSVPPGMQPSPGATGTTPAPMTPQPTEPPATPPSPGGSGTSPSQ